MITKTPKKDHTKERVVVYSREYAGTTWQVPHNLNKDNIFIQVMDMDGETYFPSSIQKVDSRNITIENATNIGGVVSIFDLGPVLNKQIITLTDFTSGELDVRYGHRNYMMQFWDSDGYMIHPNVAQKRINNKLYVEFNEEVNGEIVIINPNVNASYSSSETWNKHHSFLRSKDHIIIQTTDETKTLMIAEREQRIDTTLTWVSDNAILVEFPGRRSGNINALVYGVKI